MRNERNSKENIGNWTRLWQDSAVAACIFQGAGPKLDGLRSSMINFLLEAAQVYTGFIWFICTYMYIIYHVYIYLYIYLNKKVIILHFLSHPKLLWVRGFEFWDIPLGKGLALASREFLSSLALISLPRFRRMFQGKDPGFPNRLESLYKIGGIWQPAFLQRVHPFCQSQTICRVKLKSKT